MKSSSPRELAIFIAIIIASLIGTTLFISSYFQFENIWIVIAITVIIFFAITYYIVYQTLSSFIYDKIQPIYKSIHEYNLSQKELKRTLETKDIITEMNKEVKDWTSRKTKEIKKLKQLEKYRKEFVGNVSHELKTPIFNIQGYILTLLDGGLEDKKINILYLQRAEKSINRMISIVEDLESISRLESGELKLNFENFNIVKMVDEVFETLEMRAKAKSIKLEFAASYNKSIRVWADRKRIFEVLNNLIVNSIIYGNENGKTKVSFMDMGQNILIEITDNGIGIDEEDSPRIFERFFRTDKSRSRDQGGTGLGLSIVKHVIEAHSQTINVRSKPGKGTSFTFSLGKSNS